MHRKYRLLFFSLILLFLASPFLREFEFMHRLLGLFMVAVLVGGVRAVSGSRKHFLSSATLGVTAFLLEGLDASQLVEHSPVPLLLLETAFFSHITVLLFTDLIRAKTVSEDTITGAICVYFLIGLTWTFYFLLLEVLLPGSFNGISAEHLAGPEKRVLHFASMYYFSFITLTTVGYGDITPASHAARTLAITLSITGQMYIAVMMARLVALQIGEAFRKSD